MDAAADYAHIQAVYDAVTRAIEGAADPRWGLTLKTHLSHWYEWGAMIYPRIVIPKGPDDLDEALALHDSIVRAATMATLDARRGDQRSPRRGPAAGTVLSHSSSAHPACRCCAGSRRRSIRRGCCRPGNSGFRKNPHDLTDRGQPRTESGHSVDDC